MTTPQPLDTPLWAFSLAVYGCDGVANECIDLQERLGIDVNILLFAAYTGAVVGVQLEARDIASVSAAVASWQSGIVQPLRQARRALKRASDEASTALRAQVKAAELAAEKIEQTMLWQWSHQPLSNRPRCARDRALADNLCAVLVFYGADPMKAAVPRLLEAATAYQP